MHIYIYFAFAACVRGPEENIEPHFFFLDWIFNECWIEKTTKTHKSFYLFFCQQVSKLLAVWRSSPERSLGSMSKESYRVALLQAMVSAGSQGTTFSYRKPSGWPLTLLWSFCIYIPVVLSNEFHLLTGNKKAGIDHAIGSALYNTWKHVVFLVYIDFTHNENY